ncbi:hypothetical protein TTRE_0000849801 [Trichuris trichiura]|uniref:Abnormal cell migration protein 18-like fibronectin type I domain-containing protein n=1 Tax=Trichuris trichiura TaxID=36087 RepID=A0A077ZIE6_TRITR|nr:hypothetical protein TTRE_0000849801 [Trichuris trichiura]
MRPVKCIAAGQELNGGESIKTDSFILTCRQKGNHILGLQTDACVGEFGYAVSVGKTFKKNGLLFRCVKKDDLIGSIAIGCVIQGIAVGLSGTVNIGGFWYKCARYGSDGIQWKVMGCVDNDGERFHPGEKYREGNYVWLCKETKVAIRNALIGCVGKEFDREKEYAFGESWYEKSANQFSFRMMCVGNETSAQIIVTQCIADFELGRKVAHVGQCIRYDDERVLTCIQDEDGRVHIMLGKIDQPNLNNRYALTVEGVECPRIDN